MSTVPPPPWPATRTSWRPLARIAAAMPVATAGALPNSEWIHGICQPPLTRGLAARKKGTFGLLPAASSRRQLRQAREKGPAMYEKILAAIDESEAADRVLTAARELAALAHGHIWILHLREREPSKFGTTATETTGHAQATVDAAVQKLTAAGISAAGTARDAIFGYAAREIVAEAKNHDAGVIVMGSRGRGDLAGLLIGSTAHKVLHLTDRPVLIVR
jgi:nucleotide-binding universal stress UspA family protein